MIGNFTTIHKKALSKLEKVQRDALLSLTRAYGATSHNALLKETGVEPLSSRRERGKKAIHDVQTFGLFTSKLFEYDNSR